MFTVCPKCALTLVVTAADLRVAQGYVRCGRCSNVFNALARLSDDRQAGAGGAQAQGSAEALSTPKASPLAPARSESSATFGTRRSRKAAASGASRPAADSSDSALLRKPADPGSTSTLRELPAAEPPKYYDDDSILEEDLEFKPDAADVSQVFIEQTPSPQFTAATGTFKARRLEAEDSTLAEANGALGEEHSPATRDAPFDPVDPSLKVDIDSQLLDDMAQLTSNRLERLNLTSLAEPQEPATLGSASGGLSPREPALLVPAPQGLPTQEPGPAAGAHLPQPSPQDSASAATPGPVKTALLVKQVSQAPAPAEQRPQVSASKRLAERAKARVAAARPLSVETAQVIRAALLPRKRAAGADAAVAPNAVPTSFFAGMWGSGNVLLLLLLTAQTVHHYRHDLAATASLNGPLTSLYAAIGVPLVPRWSLSAYEVRQLGASTVAEAPGQITVRASVKNGAHQAQPMPLLRVTLQDRFGNRIAARDVPPQSYLPRAIPRSTLLAAGQRIDAEMAFVDPGADAVGFEIDACLPAPGGGIACANDAAH